MVTVSPRRTVLWRLTTMRATWLLQLGVVVGALAQSGTVVSAQELRPAQNPYSKQEAADYRAPAPQIGPAANRPRPLLAALTEDGVQTGGDFAPQQGGDARSSRRPAAATIRGMAADPPLPSGAPIPLDLDTALRWTLANNPNLVTVRQNLAVSAAALAVARRFPTSLNPSVSVDLLPWVFEPAPGGGVNRLQPLVAVTWSQPIELGHRQAFRESIASAQYNQTQWNVLQVELLTLVQTYRLHQTATYRRQKLGVAERLATSNRRLADVLRRRMDANQAPAADVILADVASQAAGQKAVAAQQEYFNALSALRQHIGNPEYAISAEPVGQLRCPEGISPGGEDALINVALESQPEIRAAEAQTAASQAALCLARADRVPIPSIGPHYEKDESGVSFYGMTVSTPVPLWNAGRALVTQREAEHRRDCVALEQARRRVITAVKATLVRWNQARESVLRTEERLKPIQAQSARMERLFNANETDIIKLLQVQQGSIDAEDTQLDVLWQATQSYADLITSAGIAPLIASLPAERAAE